MNIHEYQAKEVLREFGVPVPRGHAGLHGRRGGQGGAASSAGRSWVVKAQIHAGGRGKAGGVKVVKSIDDVQKEAAAPARLGAGHPPDRPAGQAGQPALHRGRLGDRPRALSLGAGRPRDLARRVRGVDRRRHGHRGGRARARPRRSSPSRSIRRPASCRITAGASRRRCGLTGDLAKQAAALIDEALHGVRRKDMSLLEINPLVVTKDERAHLPRRQDRLRRQRALPPPRHRGAARPDRGGREGDRGLEVRSQLHRARRHHRLHGQRRRPRHGDHGHHQALRRGAGELPRRRRRRHQGEGHGRLQDHHLRSRT